MKSYIYGLFKDDELIDETSIDEEDEDLAKSLFFEEFGHVETENMKVELLSVEEDDEDEEELSRSDINELRDFIVGSNLEWSLINQSSKMAQPTFKKWLGLEEDN
jgi:hypothetical protein